MGEVYLSLLQMVYDDDVIPSFEGLADENVWKRPAEGLLSVGEIAGHMAYWQTVRLAGEGEDMDKCKVKSLLIDKRFRYYTSTVDTQPNEQQLAMTASQVCSELIRVHEETKAQFKALNPDLDSSIPGLDAWQTYGFSLKYMIFHASYHVGQIYSARHLLGETTPDN